MMVQVTMGMRTILLYREMKHNDLSGSHSQGQMKDPYKTLLFGLSNILSSRSYCLIPQLTWFCLV